MNAGIDYGMGQTNIDKETGIRYGVIPSNDVLQAWSDQAEPDYGEENVEENEELDDCSEPIGFVIDDDEYKAVQYGDDHDIFVIKSPYYTYARFCSPCAPGAGHLRNYDPNGVKTYCFAPDWFEYYDEDVLDEFTGKWGDRETSCPYPVYRVSDGECVFYPSTLENQDEKEES